MVLDLYAENLSDNQKEILYFLHDKFMEFPGIAGKVRFKIPFYYQNSWVCYLNPVKGDKIELCFIHGQKLSNEHGLLENRNRKMVSGIMLTDIQSIPIEAVMNTFSEAILIDEDIRKAKKRK